MRRTHQRAAILLAMLLPALPALPAAPALEAAQIPFEQAAQDLASADPATRLRTVQMLKQAAFPEAAVPLAALVTDARDDIQLEAIAAELNIFLAERVVPRKRIGLVVEVRNALQAEPAFTLGPNALGPRPVPTEVLMALRTAVRDENPRVAIEALYAFGVLAVEPGGNARRDLLRASGPDVAAFIGSSDAALRYAAVRVLGRVFARRAKDEPIESTVGDAVITALNDNDRAVKAAAMHALGAMRYDRGVQALTALFAYYGRGDAADAALDALAHIANPASVPLFAAQLASKTPSLRGIAMEGLARAGDASQLEGIQALIDKERSQSAMLAGAFALVMLANGPTDRLADWLSKPKLREQAKAYLIEIAPGRTALFAHQLLDSDPQIRLDVVEVLGLAGDPAAIASVEPLMTDRDPEVAAAAERAVARLRPAQPR
jgi:HEAT repeat protein